MRYNQTTKPTTQAVENHQGGKGFKYDPKFELIGILSTGLENKYYEKLGERETRMANLIKEIAKTPKGLEFVAKALVYARSVMGQRTVTHLGAVQLTPLLSGSDLGRRFFSKRERKGNSGGIVYRLDDMLEIVACYMTLNPGKNLTNSMKKGFKAALEAADTYELAKYQAKGKQISLVDVVNLVRPKPSSKMEDTFKKLMKGELKQFNTVEDKNTASGQKVAEKVKSGEISKEEAQKELSAAKEENYSQLIKERKIGYLALLRNLKNIILNTSDKNLIKEACDLITDEKLIRQSLVFPHQIDLALEFLILELNSSQVKEVVKALNSAYELSIPNLTELITHGRTAVVFDSSASMESVGVKINGKKINKSPIEKAALIGATLAKGIGADLYQFASTCAQIKYNPGDSINTIKNIGLNQTGKVGHGTSFDSIFRALDGQYDRIFIISDLQGGDSIISNSSYQTYKTKYGEPFIYTIDIQGYGTTMFKPGKKLIQLFGYSADIYEMIKKAEIDVSILLKEIELINI